MKCWVVLTLCFSVLGNSPLCHDNCQRRSAESALPSRSTVSYFLSSKSSSVLSTLSDAGLMKVMRRRALKDSDRFSLYKHHLLPFFCKLVILQLFYGKDLFFRVLDVVLNKRK